MWILPHSGDHENPLFFVDFPCNSIQFDGKSWSFTRSQCFLGNLGVNLILLLSYVHAYLPAFLSRGGRNGEVVESFAFYSSHLITMVNASWIRPGYDCDMLQNESNRFLKDLEKGHAYNFAFCSCQENYLSSILLC